MTVWRGQLGTKDSIGFHVDEFVPLLDVLAQTTFVPHSQFLHHPTRSGIVTHVVSMDAVELEFTKGVLQYGVSGFRAMAAAPIWFADPITQFGVFLGEVDGQADGPDEVAAVLPGNGKHNLSALFKALLMATDPVFCHTVLIRMGNVLGRRRDGAITCQKLHTRRVTQVERTQNQPLGFKRGTLLCR